MRLRHYPIKPLPYVRQSQRDKWKPRDIVLFYRAYRDEVANRRVKLFEPFTHIVFLLPVFPSWWAKKQRDHLGQPHLAKPDKDNLEKGLLDAIYRGSDDAHIWTGSSSKIWAREPGIVLSDTFIPFHEDIPVDVPELLDACRY